ncbi:hypothetical protein OAW28_06560, partial [Alphaproteobacteria bacterium]|nr:hypothetical protein [Alphaproteobacteria bacterium]
LGVPLLIPADNNLFDFDEKDVFSVEKEKLLSIIYSHKNKDYVGFKHSFYKFKFLSKINIKKKYTELLDSYVDQNGNAIKHIKNLRKNFHNIGAFQTRNIPHFGHELIMKRMLKFCDHLVINPIIGPKKRGDTTVECLTFIFENLLENKYRKKISFMPILANMFYAGPREAVHHCFLRKQLGFNLFSVGRDHAGAENIYRDDEAPMLIENIKSHLGINVMTHSGAKFCKSCKKVIILGDCKHETRHLYDISGTKFRDSIMEKKFFDLADKEMQRNLFKNNMKIFEV